MLLSHDRDTWCSPWHIDQLDAITRLDARSSTQIHIIRCEILDEKSSPRRDRKKLSVRSKPGDDRETLCSRSSSFFSALSRTAPLRPLNHVMIIVFEGFEEALGLYEGMSQCYALCFIPIALSPLFRYSHLVLSLASARPSPVHVYEPRVGFLSTQNRCVTTTNYYIVCGLFLHPFAFPTLAIIRWLLELCAIHATCNFPIEDGGASALLFPNNCTVYIGKVGASQALVAFYAFALRKDTTKHVCLKQLRQSFVNDNPIIQKSQSHSTRIFSEIVSENFSIIGKSVSIGENGLGVKSH